MSLGFFCYVVLYAHDKIPLCQKDFLPPQIWTILFYQKKLNYVCALCDQPIFVEANEVKADKLPVAIGILTDKEVQVQGLPSAIVAHTSTTIDALALKQLIANARKDEEVIDAEVVTEEKNPWYNWNIIDIVRRMGPTRGRGGQ